MPTYGYIVTPFYGVILHQIKNKITMKKNIGNVLALYPTPAVVVGTEVNGKVNWLLVAHVGIIGHDQIMLSMFKKALHQ